MTTRREFLVTGGAGLCVLATPLISLAQQPGKVARIGLLGLASASFTASRVEALRAGLRDLGYVAGKNIAFEFRWAEGKYDRLPKLAAELVRLKADVILAQGTPGALAAKQATTTIPIVVISIADPIASGLIASFARPGGNITGTTSSSPDLNAKRLDLIKEVFPHAKQVAVLMNEDNPSKVPTFKAMEIPARSLNVELQLFEARGSSEFDGMFASMVKRRVDVAIVQEETLFTFNARAVADLAVKHRLPTIGGSELVDAGGLINYGTNRLEQFRRAGYFVDRILKGAKPADLPVEQATRFEVVLNLKTAKLLGIKFPQSILVRADKVIE